MTEGDLERLGREVVILETMAKISDLRKEIEHYARDHGDFETFEKFSQQVGEENFEHDETYNAWRWARESLGELEVLLATLQRDAAA